MADFQYYNGTSWADVPEYAHPTDEGVLDVTWPPVTDLTLAGKPCGAVGLPKMLFKSPFMTQQGWAFWQAFFSAGEESHVVKLKLYDTRTSAWVKYQLDLYRPVGTCRPRATGTAPIFTEIEIRGENLEVTT